MTLVVEEEELAESNFIETAFGVAFHDFCERFFWGGLAGDAVVVVVFVIILGDGLEFGLNDAFVRGKCRE